MLEGGCLCGGVRFRVSGKLGPAGYCHCKQCQRASGSAFAANAPARTQYFELASGGELISEYESSPGKYRAFCRRCGSPIYSRRDSEPDLRRIRLGSLDADPGRRPLVHVWVASKAPWHDIADSLPQFAEGYAAETPIRAASYRYYICDVFTDERFGGNQLAVLPRAEGLSDERMQQIAREFNFSETTFVLPSSAGHARRVRIFTPASEVPFAGHPNIGTAFVLASAGELGEIDAPIEVTFEEKAGPVPISIRRRNGKEIWCELSAPQALSLGKTASASAIASAVSLSPDDIVTANHPPQVASVGMKFTVAELRDLAALSRARPRLEGFEALAAERIPPNVYLYTRDAGEFDLRVRMFAPLGGVPEDPATGSAACTLAGLLSHLDAARDGDFRWRIGQGMEIGRPSALEARAEKQGGRVVATRVGGSCALVSEGRIEVD